MDRRQAAALIEHFFTAFPNYREWIHRTANPEGTISIWLDQIEACDADDVRAVIGEMIYGRRELPAAYDRDRLPAILRDGADELAAIRRAREQPANDFASARNPSGAELAHCLSEMTKPQPSRGACGTPALLKRLAGDPAPEQTSRQSELAEYARSIPFPSESQVYRCTDCRDTGAVQVWHFEIHHKLQSGKPIDRLRTVNVACHCDRGEGLRSEGKRWQPVPVYDPAIYCRVVAPDWEDLEDLAAWLSSKGRMVPEPVRGGRFVQ